MSGCLGRLALIAGACLIAQASFAPAASAQIVVGASFSLSGPAAVLGLAFQRTIPLLPKEIAGETVKYIVLDDGTDPSAAVRNVRKLATEDHADILIGPTNAPAGYAIAPVLSELKIPLISGTVLGLTGEKAAWFVNTPQGIPLWVGKIVRDMKKHGEQRVGYVGYNDTYGDLAYASFKEECAKVGLDVIAAERYARTDTSFAGQALRLAAARPDAIFIAASGSPAVLPNVALRDRGYRKPLYNATVAVGPNFLRLGGAKVEGVLAASDLISVAEQLPDSNPSKKYDLELLHGYEQLYPNQEPEASHALAYDSGIILKAIVPAALKVAKPGTTAFRIALRDAMHTLHDVHASDGTYNFKPGSPWGLDASSVVMVEVKDGKWVYLSE